MTLTDLFFIYGSELPSDVGYPMFGLVHILWLVAGALLIFLIALLYAKQKSSRGRRRLDIGIGSFLLFLIIIRDIYLLIVGHLSIFELPFHLCSMAGILSFLHCFKNWDWLGQVLYSLCFPGTLVALIFPDWTYYPPIHFITIQGYLFHFGVALYIICQLISKRIQPHIRKLWKVWVFLVILVPLIFLFNKHFGTNYFFVNTPSAGSPLEWLADWMGDPGWLIGYGILAVVITSLMDLIYMAFCHTKRKR